MSMIKATPRVLDEIKKTPAGGTCNDKHLKKAAGDISERALSEVVKLLQEGGAIVETGYGGYAVTEVWREWPTEELTDKAHMIVTGYAVRYRSTEESGHRAAGR